MDTAPATVADTFLEELRWTPADLESSADCNRLPQEEMFWNLGFASGFDLWCVIAEIFRLEDTLQLLRWTLWI